jgi:hypothetical protein
MPNFEYTGSTFQFTEKSCPVSQDQKKEFDFHQKINKSFHRKSKIIYFINITIHRSVQRYLVLRLSDFELLEAQLPVCKISKRFMHF